MGMKPSECVVVEFVVVVEELDTPYVFGQTADGQGVFVHPKKYHAIREMVRSAGLGGTVWVKAQAVENPKVESRDLTPFAVMPNCELYKIWGEKDETPVADGGVGKKVAEADPPSDPPAEELTPSPPTEEPTVPVPVEPVPERPTLIKRDEGGRVTGLHGDLIALVEMITGPAEDFNLSEHDVVFAMIGMASRGNADKASEITMRIERKVLAKRFAVIADYLHSSIDADVLREVAASVDIEAVALEVTKADLTKVADVLERLTAPTEQPVEPIAEEIVA